MKKEIRKYVVLGSACLIAGVVLWGTPAYAQDDQAAQAEKEGPAAPDGTATASEPTASESNQPAVAVKRESLKPLWISGLIGWTVVYATGMIVTGAIAEEDVKSKSVGYMAIPLAGPFIFLGAEDVVVEDFKAPIVIAGVLQLVTAGMVVAGLLIKRDVKPEPMSFGRDRPGAPRMSLLPATFGTDGAGAVFTLTHF